MPFVLRGYQNTSCSLCRTSIRRLHSVHCSHYPESGTQAQRLNGRPFHSLTRKLSQMVQFPLYHMLLPLLCIIEFSNLILEPIELSWAFKEGMLLVHPWHSAQMVAFWSCPSFAPEIILTLWNSSCTPHFISMLSTIWEGRSYIWSKKYIQIYGIFIKHWHKLICQKLSKVICLLRYLKGKQAAPRKEFLINSTISFEPSPFPYITFNFGIWKCCFLINVYNFFQLSTLWWLKLQFMAFQNFLKASLSRWVGSNLVVLGRNQILKRLIREFKSSNQI